MQTIVRWAVGLAVAAVVVAVPSGYYRWDYTRSKRLREVVPGVLYRSGQLTGDGFAEAVRRHGIRTIVNLQDEFSDPLIQQNYFTDICIRESELCRELGVGYAYLVPDLVSRRKVPASRPAAIDRFLALMDDAAGQPVLIHCHAGLHRTGVLVAVYRMEYQSWTPRQAIDELKANGFGEFNCSSANDYIKQYILTYQPGTRSVAPLAQQPEAGRSR